MVGISERQKNFEKMFFIFSNEKFQPGGRSTQSLATCLTGWLAGPKASMYVDSSDTEVLQDALESLSNIFKISISELQNELVHHQLTIGLKIRLPKWATATKRPSQKRQLTSFQHQ